MKEGQDFIFNYQSYSATMKNGLDTANNLIYTYDFESKNWTEIGYLNEWNIQVYTCTTFQTKEMKGYLEINMLISSLF